MATVPSHSVSHGQQARGEQQCVVKSQYFLLVELTCMVNKVELKWKLVMANKR